MTACFLTSTSLSVEGATRRLDLGFLFFFCQIPFTDNLSVTEVLMFLILFYSVLFKALLEAPEK